MAGVKRKHEDSSSPAGSEPAPHAARVTATPACLQGTLAPDAAEHIILVYGELSVGKSTFIKKVLDAGKAEGDRPIISAASRGTTKEVQLWPHLGLPAMQPFPECPQVHVRFLDVPGKGDLDSHDTKTMDAMDCILGEKRVTGVLCLTGGSAFTTGLQTIAKWLKLCFPQANRDELIAMVRSKADVWDEDEDAAAFADLCKEVARDMFGCGHCFKYCCHIGRADPVQPAMSIVRALIDEGGNKGQFRNPNNMFLRLPGTEQVLMLNLQSKYLYRREATILFKYLGVVLHHNVARLREGLDMNEHENKVTNNVMGTSKSITTAANTVGAGMLLCPLTAPAGATVLIGSALVSVTSTLVESDKTEKLNKYVDDGKEDAKKMVERLKEKVDRFQQYETVARTLNDTANKLFESLDSDRPRQNFDLIGGSTGVLSAGAGFAASNAAPVAASASANVLSSSASVARASSASVAPSALNWGRVSVTSVTAGESTAATSAAAAEGSSLCCGLAKFGTACGFAAAGLSMADLYQWANKPDEIMGRIKDERGFLDQFEKGVKSAQQSLKEHVLTLADGTADEDLALPHWFRMHVIPANTRAKENFTFGQNQTFTDSDVCEIAASLDPQSEGSVALSISTLRAQLSTSSAWTSTQNHEIAEAIQFEPLDHPTVVWQLALIGFGDGGPVLYQTKRIARRPLQTEPDPVSAARVQEYYRLEGGVIHV